MAMPMRKTPKSSSMQKRNQIKMIKTGVLKNPTVMDDSKILFSRVIKPAIKKQSVDSKVPVEVLLD